MKRTTQRDLAAALDLSVSAVSLALRGHASIPLATQERVLAKAEELGYRQDARVAQHMAYIRSRHKHNRLLPLAYVHNFDAPLKELSHAAFHRAFAAARQRAEELGYYLEEFWVDEAGLSYRRLQQILESRSFEGIYLHITSEEFPDWDVKRFAVVANGPPFRHSEVHSVQPDAVYNFDLLFQKMVSAGCFRIGVCQWGTYGDAVYRSILPKTLAYFLEKYPEQQDIPMLHLDSKERENKAAWSDWVKKWKPDVILSNDLEPFLNADDVWRSLSLLSWDTSEASSPELSGVDRNLESIAEVTVEQLIGMINRNERGVPANPHAIQIKGHWVPGKTFACKR